MAETTLATNRGAEAKAKAAGAASLDKHVKAEASDKNRRDAKRSRTADAGRPAKRQGKEASLRTDRSKANVRGRHASGRKLADSKRLKKSAAALAKAKNHLADRNRASDKNQKKL